MLVRDYGVLRPEYFKPYGGSPAARSVYPDLGPDVGAGGIGAYLAEPMKPSDRAEDTYIRHLMAVCSGYSYETLSPVPDDGRPARPASERGRGTTNAVSEMLARLGLPNRARVVAEYIDAMLVRSTATIVQSLDKKVVILVYRGTEPTNIVNWLLDVEVHSREPEKVLIQGAGADAYDLHVGFYRNVRATRAAVLQTLRYALAGQDIHRAGPARGGDLEPLPEPPALYVTGHSLGGAMAAIMGVMLATNPLYEELGNALRAVYTFGQPMVGSQSLVDLYGASMHGHAPLVRFVNRQDPVPRVPSAETGAFTHFGVEYRRTEAGGAWTRTHDGHGRADGRNRPVSQMLSIAGLELAFAGFPAGQIGQLDRMLPYNIVDHFPSYYIETLAPAGVSEFGDDEFVPVRPARGILRRPVRGAVDGFEQLVARGATGAVRGGTRALAAPIHLWKRAG